ncbi:MAG TPA: HK97 family phage prohead protease [Brevibacterium sp.]|nr:HK97 family phage prohead protease [Brevibacterium sp.]
MKIKSLPIGAVKAGPDDGLKDGEFVVYPATFIRKPDAYGDVIAKGAFARTIKEWQESGNVLPGLFGHRMDDPDFFVASALEMDEDEHGWRVKGVFDLESPKAAQVYRLVKGRRLSQLSFAYDVRDEGRVELDDGQKANELRDLKVYEFSFVPIGANQDTSVVAVKGIADAMKASTNTTALREMRDAIDSALTSLEEQDGKAASAADQHDQEKASGDAEAKSDASDEEPAEAKSSVSDEEPKPTTPVERLAAQAHIYALTGAERGSR